MRTRRLIVQMTRTDSSPKRGRAILRTVNSDPKRPRKEGPISGSGTPAPETSNASTWQPCCDVVVDESGELRLTIAGDWSEQARAEQLLTTLKSVAAYGSPNFVDTKHLGPTSAEVRELLAEF